MGLGMDMGRGTGAYSILDPTGNITALVEHPVAVPDQPAVAAAIMARHPLVEQVGFVRLADDAAPDGPHVELRMAGGEFCGNATMSAAALGLLRMEERRRVPAAAGDASCLLVRASGAAQPVLVRLTRQAQRAFAARVRMPAPRAIRQVDLAFEGLQGQLPLVCMEGISHVVVASGSAFFRLRRNPSAAERAVRAWCERLGVDGLGLMFVEGSGASRRMDPLVFVPASDTVFWEHSCASGSSAVGMWLAAQAGAHVALELSEPGGTLRVESDPPAAPDAATWLIGTTRVVEEYS